MQEALEGEIRFNVRLPRELHRRLKVLAAEEGKTLGELVRESLSGRLLLEERGGLLSQTEETIWAERPRPAVEAAPGDGDVPGELVVGPQ